MTTNALQIDLEFSQEDQAWIRRSRVEVPKFWQGHAVDPLVGDVLRIGGRQFVIRARVWDQRDNRPHLRLLLTDARAQSDTSFG